MMVALAAKGSVRLVYAASLGTLRSVNRKNRWYPAPATMVQVLDRTQKTRPHKAGFFVVGLSFWPQHALSSEAMPEQGHRKSRLGRDWDIAFAG